MLLFKFFGLTMRPLILIYIYIYIYCLSGISMMLRSRTSLVRESACLLRWANAAVDLVHELHLQPSAARSMGSAHLRPFCEVSLFLL